MYVRRNIRFKYVLVESWGLLLLIFAWSVTVVLLHEIVGFHWLVVPVLPVTLVGIAVSLFVGFKSASAYNRWWEARRAVEGIVIHSRDWLVHVRSYINCADPEGWEVAKKLLSRHLGWVFAVAHMLRSTSRLKASARPRLFNYRWAHKAAAMHQDPQSYGRFLDPEEYSAAQTYKNPATYLLCQQADSIRELLMSGNLNNTQQVMLTRLLGTLAERQGMCERIKYTPFPRQIASFAAIFTWIFVLLLPLAFIDVFESAATRERLSHMLTDDIAFILLAPLAAAISWVFL